MPRPARATLVLALLAPLSSAQVVPGFHAPGIAGDVRCSAVHDDGSGSRLFLGGKFDAAGTVGVLDAARWNGHTFEPGGNATPFAYLFGVFDLREFDDGAGPRLYGAGNGGVYVWEAGDWSLFAQVTGTCIVLSTLDLGGTRYLAVGGGFSTIEGLPIANLALWDGASWSGLELPPNVGSIQELALLERAGKYELFAGGHYTTPPTVWHDDVLMRWDGVQWTNVPVTYPHFGLATGALTVLEVVEEAGGPVIYAGGAFSSIDGVMAHGIARYDGTAWSAVGAGPGVGLGAATPGRVASMHVHSPADGSGPVLTVVGAFDRVDGQPAENLAFWRNGSWEVPLPGLGGHGSHVVVWDPPGPLDQQLLVFGSFGTAGGVPGGGGARWDGTQWSQLSGGLGVGGPVNTMAWFDEGAGEEQLFVGGDFDYAGRSAARSVARWDGQRWSEVGTGLEKPLRTLNVLDLGEGPALYAGGENLRLDHELAGVVRWDGVRWTNLAPGSYWTIFDLEVYDSGQGPELYAGGVGEGLGPVYAGVARWDGSHWQHTGVEFTGEPRALEVYDGGQGPLLVVAGNFYSVGQAWLAGLAAWDGSAWDLPPNFPYSFFTYTSDLLLLENGTQTELVISGSLPGIKGNIGRWDGQQLLEMGYGKGPGHSYCMGLGAGPGGPELYAVLDRKKPKPSGLSRWTGTVWTELIGVEGARALATGGTLSSGLFIGLDGNRRIEGVQVGGFAQYDLGCDQLATFCDAQPPAPNCKPTTTVAGFPSIGPNQPFVFRSTGNEFLAQGVVVYGIQGPQPPFGSTSALCLAPPVRAVPMTASWIDPLTPCQIDLELDFNDWIRSGHDPALVAGQTIHLQPAVKNGSKVTYLTAYEATICP